MRRPAAALATVAVLATGCGDGATKQAAPTGTTATTSAPADGGTGRSDAGTSADGTTTAAESAAPAFDPGARRRGDGRDFPLPVGAGAPVGTEWEVELVGYDPDATEEVLAFNAGNEPPPDGEVFALARIRATYVGPDASANAFLNLEWALVDDAGQLYTDADCGVLPDDLASQSGAPQGGSAEGTICFSTPVAVLDHVVLHLAPLLGQDDTRVWWEAPSDGAGRVLGE